VKDNGIGLKSEDSKYIFESFRQGEEGTTKKYGGAGLGLTLSKGIVDNLGGRIWYEHNDEGHGSIFYVQIPLIPSTENKVKKSQNFVNQMEGKYNWQGKKILVVEDSNMAYELIVKLLKGTEAEFSQEVDGYKAIERCKKDSTIDLVLMDIQLPFLDGYEATKRIKQIRPKLPIIAQTANAMLDDRKKALDAGCEDYIAKPIDRMELADKINNLFFKVKEQS
jgi:CheY-like chemotaxis protein